MSESSEGIKVGDIVTGPAYGIWRVEAITGDEHYLTKMDCFRVPLLNCWHSSQSKKVTLEEFFELRKYILVELKGIERELRDKAMSELVRLSEEMGLYDQA